jgi:uncharacterized protein with GYD domain
MAHFLMLTRITPEAVSHPGKLEALEKEVTARVEADCPEVRWIANYSVLGPCDYVDVFEAPDLASATKVALIVRSFGHATTEVWPALEWHSFREIARGMKSSRET